MVENQDVHGGAGGDHAIPEAGQDGRDEIHMEAPAQHPRVENPGPAPGPAPPVHYQHQHHHDLGGLRRSGTLPPMPRSSPSRDRRSPDTRRRGVTLTAGPHNVESSPMSRPHMAGRNNPADPAASEGERMNPIPEGEGPRASGDNPSLRRDGSTNSRRARFSSSGIRPRVGTWTSSAQPRPRGSTVNRRRPSVALAPTVSGRAEIAADAPSQAEFSLAGPPLEVTLPANQPYVDPGYSQLNPAYDQPPNARPVWGLAKPLPRVLRPGMVPSRDEIEDQQQDLGQDAGNVDVEQGRIEPTLRLDKISSQLQSARQNRENQLFQTYSRKDSQGTSNLGRIISDVVPLTPPSEVIDEDEESDDLGPFPSLDDRQKIPSSTGQGRKRFSRDRWYPDDAYSITTAQDEDGYLDGDDLHAIPLKAYEPSNEIHNLHTHWSVIRLRFREPLAELLAVTVQLTLGFCADLTVTVSRNAAGNEATTDWAWGLATMVGIYIAGGISGAHLNPAISIMLWVFRGFPLRKIPMYVLAQVLGAFLAGLIAFGLYQKDIIAYGGSNLGNGNTAGAFITYPRLPYIDAGTAFFNEFTATAILAVAVLAMGDDTNAPPGAGMNAFILGLVVTVLSMAFGYNTGAAMNPSRDFGPRLALLAMGYGGSVFYDHDVWWLYGPWAATIMGAIFGAFLYDAAIFVGGESPVNYPRQRIRRAGRKWRVRWGRRIKRATGRVGRGMRDDDEDNVFGGKVQSGVKIEG